MTLSAAAYIEKNKIASDTSWLVLLDITMPDTTLLKITSNSEDVWWPATVIPSNLYTSFPFELGEIGDASKWEVPSVSLKVSNVTRYLESQLDAQDGLVDSNVEIKIVNSINVVTPTKSSGTYNDIPEITLNYDVVSSSSNSMWVEFILGASNPFNKRFPRNKIYRNICRYRFFKGARCQYVGAETSCDRTLDTCRNTYNNSINFGGCPGVASKGIYV